MSTSNLLLNLTPHNILIYPTSDDGQCIMYPKSGTVVRLNSTKQVEQEILEDGCPVYTPQKFTSVTPREPPRDKFTNDMRGVIVSMPVAEFLCANRDLNKVYDIWGEIYGADTGPEGAVRNEHGVIIGTRRLVRYLGK